MQGDEDTPVAPVNPVAPVDPVAPVNPVAPVDPMAPVNPVAPVPPASFQEGVSVEQQPPCALQTGRGWRRHVRG